MNLEHFIAKRIAFSKNKTFTRVIIRIAIAAIALSLAVMIITTSVIAGFKKEISRKTFGFWGHIHITDTNINRTFEQVPIDERQECFAKIDSLNYVEYQKQATFLGYPIEGKYVRKRTKGGVLNSQKFAITSGIISTKNDFEGILLKGIGEDFNWNAMDNFIVDGRAIELNGEEASNEVVISRTTADRLQSIVGDRIMMSFIKDNDQIKKGFVIVGIYNTGLEEYDRRFALADINKVREVLGWENYQIGGVEVFLDDINDMNVITDYIYYDILPANLYCETIQEKNRTIFEWLKLQDINEQVILQLMVIVGIMNMITALLILILERTHMIGTLKALGSSNWRIRKLFMYNAGYIIFFGLIAGNFLGLSLIWLQKKFAFITLDEKNYYLSVAPVEWDIWMIVLLNVGTFVITLIFLLLPSMLISRITPIKALRFG